MPWWKAVSFTVLLVLMLAAGLFFIINTAWREDRQREANMAYCRPFEMFYAKKLPDGSGYEVACRTENPEELKVKIARSLW
jgi:hypothetical protein